MGEKGTVNFCTRFDVVSCSDAKVLLEHYTRLDSFMRVIANV